jgi:outer membrane lipoprotein-sorting protein
VRTRRAFLSLLVLLPLVGTTSAAELPPPEEIMKQVLNTDAWGLGDAAVSARAIIKDGRGGVRELSFTGRSQRYAPPLTKSLIRFRTPADVAGVGFLQIQKADEDDDRHLFLPELGKSRRVAGNTRSNLFMGTDFSYADLDRRDLREGTAIHKGMETLGKFPCYRMEVTPKRADSPYAKIELWVRTDNFVPLKTLRWNRAGVLLKTLVAQELRRVDGRWFLGRSLMTNHADGRTTELILDEIRTNVEVPADEFTVRTLEKT